MAPEGMAMERAEPTAIADQIEALETARYQAMLAGDADTLAPLLGADLVYGHSTGAVDSKATYLAGVRAQTLTYQAIERAATQVQVYGDAAVASGRARLNVVV